MDFGLVKKRRQQLHEAISAAYPNAQGALVLFAGLEHERYRFRQESSFYYLTGIEEPGVVLVSDKNAQTTLYAPDFGDTRAQWVASSLYNTSKEHLSLMGLDKLDTLGQKCVGYTFSCLFSASEYSNLIATLKSYCATNKKIFTLFPASKGYTEQRLILERLQNFIPELANCLIDISPLVATMRRNKSQAEVEAIYKAVDCTMAAHEAVAHVIEANNQEFQVQAGVEFVFTESGARPAFPSIVASGVNATVLHYNANTSIMKKGDLLVVDIGAEIDYYCADLSRTYPISGNFTKRQRELYTIVLDTQEYIASIAKPGYWLVNKDRPEKSLHHLAQEYLKKAGYGKYFTHSIGHFLGLDVHDVGDYSKPLAKGDVITLEPGIYIPEEKLGIRIEDNYWIVEDGNVCLSEDLPKNPDGIEELMVQEDQEVEEDYN